MIDPVANLLDVRLVGLASSAGATYTRYADDITFSSNNRDFPPELAVAIGHSWQPSKQLRGVIERTGFTINDSKTHMMYRRSRQEVTGLIVNKKVNIKTEYRHLVRAMVHRLVTTGSFDVLGLSKDGGIEQRPGTLKSTKSSSIWMGGWKWDLCRHRHSESGLILQIMKPKVTSSRQRRAREAKLMDISYLLTMTYCGGEGGIRTHHDP